MMFVGLDDTDIIGSRGTNQLARAIVAALSDSWRCVRIVRHQLLLDHRVPYTSRNGSASIWLEPTAHMSQDILNDRCRKMMLDWYIEGSDPGLCVAESVSDAVCEYGEQCQQQLMTQQQAETLAAKENLYLVGLGGSHDGIIGALAAVGLAAGGNDGRVILQCNWSDEAGGVQDVEKLSERDVQVRQHHNQALVTRGRVDLGKKLRPNLRENRCVLYVRQTETEEYQALKLP